MKNRIDIVGEKVWDDNDNAYNSRPSSVEIVLYRNGEEYKSTRVTGGQFKFSCVSARKNWREAYTYTVDERDTPSPYQKEVDGFVITNTYIPTPFALDLTRATADTPTYQAEPNAWGKGGLGVKFFMVDKIKMQSDGTPILVKWDVGTHDVAHFEENGTDITATFAEGLPVFSNGSYTIFARFDNGYQTAVSINVDKIRDGSTEMPYLMIDYTTATAMSAVTGIGQYTPDFLESVPEKLYKAFELYEDIDMAGVDFVSFGTVIDTFNVGDGFSGSFDGNGHEISNLTLHSTQDPQALFGSITGNASIKNLSVSGDIDSFLAGGIVALARTAEGDNIVLENLTFNGYVHNSGVRAYVGNGGIVGLLVNIGGNFLIDDCKVDATVMSRYTGGGIVGSMKTYVAADTKITNCVTRGTLIGDGTPVVGGMVGETSIMNSSLTIDSCVSFMNADTNSLCAGILAGAYAPDNANILVSNCINRGNLKSSPSSYAVGGIVGAVGFDTENVTVTDCYNTGNLEGNSDIGGIVGTQLPGVDCKVLHCYNLGTIATKSPCGGISSRCGTVKSCASIGASMSSSDTQTARILPKTSYSTQKSTLENNVAYVDMKIFVNSAQVSPLHVGANLDGGANTQKVDILNIALYETTLGWDFGSIWAFGNGSYTLPVLKSVPLALQPDTLPTHLV